MEGELVGGRIGSRDFGSHGVTIACVLNVFFRILLDCGETVQK